MEISSHKIIVKRLRSPAKTDDCMMNGICVFHEIDMWNWSAVRKLRRMSITSTILHWLVPRVNKIPKKHLMYVFASSLTS